MIPLWHVSSRSGAVLVAQTAIRFLTLPYLTRIQRHVVKIGKKTHGVKVLHYDNSKKSSGSSLELSLIQLTPPMPPTRLFLSAGFSGVNWALVLARPTQGKNEEERTWQSAEFRSSKSASEQHSR